ncbi:MAG TPA: glycoside hydrolase N-terminal domain-containing protein [Pyrinomonadaceae bacterium]|nr:glycoside hydrolase N-terminal domain-containing protein [Pyrinomonadaceae bacterium]
MKRRITRRKFLSRTALATVTFPFASSLLNAFSHDSRAADNTDDQTLMLWFDKPASEWTEALPVGNGRLGAMIFGGTAGETSVK